MLLAAQNPPAAAPAKPAAAAKPAVAAPKPAAPAAAKPAVAAAKPVAPAKPAAAKPIMLNTDEEKTIYALGLSVAGSISQFDLSPAELEIIKRALTDAADKKPAIALDDWGPKINGLVTARRGRLADKQVALSKEYLTKAAGMAGAVKCDSGLVYQDITPGTGASPKDTDKVKVHYKGTLIDGTEFDSSYKRNEPAEFPLNGVIKCWTEGVQRMKVGGKAKLSCPSDIAYGDAGRPPVIPGKATLIFEIELLDITTGK